MPFSLKIVFSGDIRRFQLSDDISSYYTQLQTLLNQAYGTQHEYILKYDDDEQERVTITSQNELEEAIDVVKKQNKILKIFVTVKDETAPVVVQKPTPIITTTPAPTAAAPAPVETPVTVTSTPTAAPTSTATPTADDTKPTADLSNPRVIINLVLELLSDPLFLRALPSLAMAAIDAFIATSSFEKTLDAVINVNDGVKNHASIVALLPHAQRYAPLADIKYAHAKGFILNLLPLARQYVTLLPTFLPRVVEYLMSLLEEWDRAEKQEETKQDGTDPILSVFENIAKSVQTHPVIAPMLASLGVDPTAMLQQGSWRCGPLAQMLRAGGRGGCPVRGGAGAAGWGRRGGCRRVDQPVATPLPTEEKGDEVHAHIICDMCNANPIRGIRYKCTVCPDYDLCASCEGTGRHPADHPLIKIVKTRRTPEQEIHSGVACDGCRQYPISGIRFKCTVCPDYDLCSTCEAKNIHPADHNLIKIKTPTVRPAGGDAPAASGRYWDMNRQRRFQHCPAMWRCGTPTPPAAATDATPTPVVPSTPTAASSTSSSPSGPLARFVRAANIPDRTEVGADQTLIKTWVIANSGETVWPQGSRLIFVRGDRILSTEEEFSIPLAAPGEEVEIHAVLRTPTTAGRYTAYYRLADAERTVWGPRVWVDVVVVAPEGPTTTTTTPAVTTIPSVTVEDEKVDDIKSEARQDVATAPTTTIETVVAPADDFVHVQAPSPVAADVASAAPTTSPVVQVPVPVPAAPVPAAVEAVPVPAPAAAFTSVFPIQNNALVSMGFTERDLNEWVLNKHAGNLQQAANYLLERLKL